MILFPKGTVGIWMLDCSPRGNASRARGQRSAAAGAREDFLNGTAGIWMLDSSLEGNASIAGGQRSAAAGARNDFVSERYRGNLAVGLFAEGQRVNSRGPA